MPTLSSLFPDGQRPDPVRAVCCAAGIAMTLVLYHFFGCDSEMHGSSLSMLDWLKPQWRGSNENFGYTWLMIPFAVWIIWRNRAKMLVEESGTSWLGVVMTLGLLLCHIIGFRSQLPRLSLAALGGLFFSIPYAIYGWKVARWLLFPCCYIELCFCGSFLTEFTMPLRKIASQLACILFHGVGIQAVTMGTVITSNAGGGFQFEVADGCSGLRSLIVMTALAAPYAYFTMQTPWKRILLFALSVPLAMLSNTLRIFTIGLIAEWIGTALAMQLYHDMSGFIVLFISIVLLKASAALINHDWKKVLCASLPAKSSRA